jgi:hypothetical protein
VVARISAIYGDGIGYKYAPWNIVKSWPLLMVNNKPVLHCNQKKVSLYMFQLNGLLLVLSPKPK